MVFRSAVLLALALASAFAQEAARSGTLTGIVTDPTEAAVVGAKVSVVNTATGSSTLGQTNETGRYYIPYLNPGPYEIKVEAAGFQAYIRKGLELRAGESPRIDIALQVGSMSDSVTVTGAAPLLQTEDSITMASLPNAAFERIPVMQARTWNILTYLPGVVTTGWNAYYSLGQSNRSLGHSLDGMSAKQPVIGVGTSVQALETSMDAMDEVRMLTTGIPAEYGHGASGMLVAVMKTGTNQLHGSAEDRYLNNKLLHRRYFDSVKPSPTSYHEMQASLNGPVVLPKIYNGRNRTFFVFGWERHHEKASETEISSVPNQDMLNGNFSFGGIGLPVYNPFTTRQDSAGKWVRDQFPGNQIPVSQFDPVAKKFLSYNPWQSPNQAGFLAAGGPQQNLALPTRVRYYLSRFDFKVDHQVSASHRFFVRANRNRNRQLTNRGYTSLKWDLLNSGFVPEPSDITGVGVSDTIMINSTTINQLRLGYNRFADTRVPESINQNWAQTLGIPNVSGATFPVFSNGLTQGAGLPYTTNPGGFLQQRAEDFTVSENLTKILGKHTLKMGWEVFRSRFNNLGQDTPSGTYYMGGTDFPFQTQTGNAFAAFLLGSVSSATFTKNFATWLPRWWTHGLYVQDDFKVTRNLTVNLGLRWTYETPFKTKYAQQSTFNAAVQDPVTGRMGAITHPQGSLAARDLNNFQPRIGLAYNFKSKLVFRGSFGTSPSDLLSPSTNLAFDEYVATANVQPAPGDPRIAFMLSQGPGAINYSTNSDGSIRFNGTNYSARNATWYDPSMRNPYIMTWSAGVQWQFGSTWLTELNYQGSAGVGLLQSWNMNAIPLNVSSDPTVLQQIYQATQNYKPYPQFGNILAYSNFGHSTYHAGTLRFEKRYSHGMTLNTFYTYSKALDTSDSDGSLVSGITYYNRSLEKAVAGYDITHRFVTTYTVDLPFGVGRRFLNSHGWGDRLVGGWKFTWSQTAQSGLPFTVSCANSPNRYLPGACRPNVLLPFNQAVVQGWQIGPNRFPTAAQNSYLNSAAFAYPAAFTAGTLGRNTFRGPLIYWPQASLAKEWSIRDRARFSVRWDVNNVFKRPQFGRPGSSFDATNLGVFGRYTGEIGNFGELGGRFHSILVFRVEW